MDAVLLDRAPQRRALAEHVRLADELAERRRPQPLRERRNLARAPVGGVGEEVAHDRKYARPRVRICRRHVERRELRAHRGDLRADPRSHRRGARRSSPGARVLDVACGTGGVALRAARAGADVIGDRHLRRPAREGAPRRGGRGPRASGSTRATARSCRTPTPSSTRSPPPSARSSRPTTSARRPSSPASAGPAAGSRSPRGRRTSGRRSTSGRGARSRRARTRASGPRRSTSASCSAPRSTSSSRPASGASRRIRAQSSGSSSPRRCRRCGPGSPSRATRRGRTRSASISSSSRRVSSRASYVLVLGTRR